MIQLIKTKKTYQYYLQIMAVASSFLLGSYVLSVSANEQKSIKTSFTTPSALTILSEKKLNKSTVVNNNNLQLSVNLPEKLLISDSEIEWQVRKNGKAIHQLEGSQQSVKLAAGLYQIRLKIGKYQAEKQVTIHKGQQVRPYFQVDVGRLEMSADHLADWKITGSDNVSYPIRNKRSVSEVLPAGEYQVKMMLASVAQKRIVTVKSGKQSEHHLEIPLGKVNLMAIRDNQPLLQSMKWEVFRLGKGGRHKVAEYHLHAKSVDMPPGQYEAVARHQDKTSKRRFWVQKETTNKVVLVME
uniref:Uncharacterized protein n=1 Tax=uncultured Thiotrichaceae bacterium TaxID=298394 RepID=A0A6S6UIU3_9GAMM|nr:MAG: Unknown protein [uncultured Thiotrichaceae bacterium]